MEFLASPEAAHLGLAGLFLSSFLAATLLPGGSELALFALIQLQPELTVIAVLLATLGNTLGGLSSYGLARLLPDRYTHGLRPTHLAFLRRWGPAALFFAWTPVVGDLLCLAAGGLRLAVVPCTVWMALGKGLRYALVVAAATVF
jgi:membrane protein YqaA with SNARE-associated domain